MGSMQRKRCPGAFWRSRVLLLAKKIQLVTATVSCYSCWCHTVCWNVLLTLCRGFYEWCHLSLLISDILIHLKGCAKTVPLHTTLPANPRYWLGADSKATPVGLCTTQSQVITRQEQESHTEHKCLSFSFIHAHAIVIYFQLQWHFCCNPQHCLYFSSIWTLECDREWMWSLQPDYCHIPHVISLNWFFWKKPRSLVQVSPTINELSAVLHLLSMVLIKLHDVSLLWCYIHTRLERALPILQCAV